MKAMAVEKLLECDRRCGMGIPGLFRIALIYRLASGTGM